MGPLRLLLPLALASVLAGCALGNESSDGADESADPALLLQQYYDIVAPFSSDCTGAGMTEWAPASFDVPAGAKWARIEGTFTGARVGMNVADQDARRVGFAAGPSPVVVVLEESSLIRVSKLVAHAYACEGGTDVPVRVYATFRSASP